MSDYQPITGELRAAMETALDGDSNVEVEIEVSYCRKERFAQLCDRIDAVHAALERENENMREGIDSDGVTLVVHPFKRDTDKDAARKPGEEAMEVYAAWELLQRTTNEFRGITLIRLALMDLADELADCITACVNLADRYDLNLSAALSRVERHNRQRGRYDQLGQ